MPLFEVSLSRTFVVKIRSQTAIDAAKLSEFFLGYMDISIDRDREKFTFEFEDVEMTSNDAVEVIKVGN